nr:hypothetical protein [Prosthecodimorpha staleyi]
MNMMSDWFEPQRPRRVGCTVDIENTAERLHAHVSLDGYEPEPGDEVIVHDAPVDVPFGAHIVVRREATVIPASRLGWLFSKAAGYLELTELYEVGFQEGRPS